ncbi:MAG: hypothetical protein ACLFM7_07165, partial [Bacteroidales bacterium]
HPFEKPKEITNSKIQFYKRLTNNERYELFDILNDQGYVVFYLENFEVNGNKIKIERNNMADKKHFEMLAIHQSKYNNPRNQ